jgi:hypothetical protein
MNSTDNVPHVRRREAHFGGGGVVGKPVEKGGIFHVDVDEKVALNGLQRIGK